MYKSSEVPIRDHGLLFLTKTDIFIKMLMLVNQLVLEK